MKILMHSLRYPHAIVNGLLVMEKKNKLNKSNRLVDCIPLFHSSHGLTPMLEVALNQVYLTSKTIESTKSNTIIYSECIIDFELK